MKSDSMHLIPPKGLNYVTDTNIKYKNVIFGGGELYF